VQADGQVVNNVLPHPHLPMLVTSGIDDEMRAGLAMSFATFADSCFSSSVPPCDMAAAIHLNPFKLVTKAKP
jgi:hypothetical protein